MKYLVQIEHTGNLEKTAKLTISSKEYGVVLSKIPVVLQSSGLDVKSINKMNGLKLIDVVADKLFEHYDSNGSYKETIEEIKKATGGSYIGTKEQAIIKSSPSRSAIFSQDKTSLVLDREHFEKIKSILESNTFTIEMKKVLFQFGTSKVQEQAKPDLNSLLGRLNTITDYMEKEQKTVEERMRKRAEEERSKEKPKETVIVEQKSKQNTAPQNKKTPAKNKKNNAIKSNFSNSRRKDDNEFDALDIALMYAYPNMGIFLRPTSPIAWFMYFSNQPSPEKIQNEFRNVPGFENFERCEVKETNNGYFATFFDKDGNSPECSLEFNDFDNTYTINSSDGLTTKLTQEDDNKFNVKVGNEFDFGSGSDIGTTDINLTQTNDGFIGNWSSGMNGINTESGITISNDFEVDSTPGELNYSTNSYDFSNTPTPNEVQVDNSQDFSNTPAFDYGDSNSNTNNNTYSFEPDDYTPPPPPPPRDEWGSSDPYSNGSSFTSGPSF